MSRIDSLTQIRVRLTHVTTQVSPTSLERIRQAWAGVPVLAWNFWWWSASSSHASCSPHVKAENALKDVGAGLAMKNVRGNQLMGPWTENNVSD
jgi:hypothetical protein